MQVLVVINYLKWQYTEGIAEFIRIWGNLLWFFYHFFSVPDLTRTFFQPFKRLQEGYGRGLDIQRYMETFILNFVMRIVGMIVRTVFLAMALLAELLVLVGGTILFIFFVGSPIVIPVGFFTGLTFLFL